jgi:hypothetical protein
LGIGQNGYTGSAGTTFSGVVGLTNGSIAAPSLYFTSETNTGLFRPGANTLGVTVLGGQRVSISDTQTSLTTPLAGTTATFTSTGTSNILNQTGITISNTLSAVKLEVVNGQLSTEQNSQLVTSVFRSLNPNTSRLEISEVRGITGSTWESSGIRLQQKIDTSYMAYIQFNTGTAIANSKGISFGTGIGGTINAPVERLRITDGGNVGIGTSSPAYKLQVVGDAETQPFAVSAGSGNITYGYFGSQGYLWHAGGPFNFGTFDAYELRLATSNAVRLTVTNAGDVGIGTSSPTNKLEVVGDVKANNIRIKLTGNITIYVATNGNNSNTGLTVGSPFATVQKAWDTLYNGYDLNGYQATIQLADGTYNQTLLARGLITGQQELAVVITGGTGVTWDYSQTQNGSTIICNGALITLTGGMTIQRSKAGVTVPTDQSGWCIISQIYGAVIIQNIKFGYAIHGHMVANAFGVIVIGGSYSISGGAGDSISTAVAGRHMLATSKGIIQTSLDTGKTVTITASVTFSWGVNPGYFVDSNYLSLVNLAATTYLTWVNPGNVTAKRYSVSYNAVIATGGQLVPGNQPGEVTTGGQVQ